MKLNLLLLSAAALAIPANGKSLRRTQANEEEKIDLGSAKEFAILTKTGISTDPTALSFITGDIGVSPIAHTAITGFALDKQTAPYSHSSQIQGRAYAADWAPPTPVKLITAVSDMEAAYSAASQRSSDDPARTDPGANGEIGDMTLTHGVYTFGTDITISDDVAFQGGANDVFIIKTTGNILQEKDTKMILGDVQAKNIFWQVAGQVTVGESSEMKGILLVKEAVTFVSDSSLEGRVLAQTRCNLVHATITAPEA
jgi:hypothetical protein